MGCSRVEQCITSMCHWSICTCSGVFSLWSTCKCLGVHANALVHMQTSGMYDGSLVYLSTLAKYIQTILNTWTYSGMSPILWSQYVYSRICIVSVLVQLHPLKCTVSRASHSTEKTHIHSLNNVFHLLYSEALWSTLNHVSICGTPCMDWTLSPLSTYMLLLVECVCMWHILGFLILQFHCTTLV